MEQQIKELEKRIEELESQVKKLSLNLPVSGTLPTRCLNEDFIHKGYLDKCRNQNMCELCRQ